MSSTLLTSITTLIGGLILFILSQFTLKIVIEPVVELRKVIGKISYQMVFYADIYSNPIEYGATPNERLDQLLKETQSELRKSASEIEGCIQVIPFYRLFSFYGLIPTRKEIGTVSANLIGLSNSLWRTPGNVTVYDHNENRRQEIIKCLHLK